MPRVFVTSSVVATACSASTTESQFRPNYSSIVVISGAEGASLCDKNMIWDIAGGSVISGTLSRQTHVSITQCRAHRKVLCEIPL